MEAGNSLFWLEEFHRAGAIWEYKDNGPHASFEAAPLHTNFYFHTGIVSANAALLQRVAEHFAGLCRQYGLKPDYVATYVAEVANGSKFASALSDTIDARVSLIDLNDQFRSTLPQPGRQVLVITDDVVSGGSLRKTLQAIKDADAVILPLVLTLGNLSASKEFDSCEVISLFHRPMEIWPTSDCPLCKTGSPVLRTRSDWMQLVTS